MDQISTGALLTQPPTRLGALVFAAKVAGHRVRRAGRDALGGPRRHPRVDERPDLPLAAESRTPLWSDARPEESEWQRGKVRNLRLACERLDGVLVPAGEAFSFWKQLGKASAARGFVPGRMLQQGCLVPAIGGGLCQLSNALYDAALRSGCEILERHAHSRAVPGSAAEHGRDATVAWNYVDLRFRPCAPLLIQTRIEDDELVVRFLTEAPAGIQLEPQGASAPLPAARTCATCDETSCFRHEGGG